MLIYSAFPRQNGRLARLATILLSIGVGLTADPGLARADCASLRTRRLFGIWQQPYYIAQEIETTTDGMSIAIPEKEWTLFTQVSLVELGTLLPYIASYVD